MTIKLIGIAGNATSGKDSLFHCLDKIFERNNIDVERRALADIIKVKLDDFTRTEFGISSFTQDIEQKNLIRNFMVYYADVKRSQSNGTFFTKTLQPLIEESWEHNVLPIITDLRFCEYPQDELYWLKQNKGVLVYVDRFLSDGQLVPPPNDHERKNNVELSNVADYHLTWVTTNDMNVRMDSVNHQLKGLIKRIIDEGKYKGDRR